MRIIILIFILGLAASCSQPSQVNTENITPKYITDSVQNDSDDPAIWINKSDPSKSLILGTDKEEGAGGLYAFDLRGKMLEEKKVYPLDRPNNVDIAYDFVFNQDTIDIAVCTERGKGLIRVFSLPDLQPIDNGGIAVFADDSVNNLAMGVALYTHSTDGSIFAIVSRKEGTANTEAYLYQYLLVSDSIGVRGELVRKFGQFSGSKEIEAVAVDNELGYVYYSDEQYGIHKYYADPDKGNEELAVFGLDGFTDDREGISIYKKKDGTGYILVSDQGAHQFQVFAREGSNGNPHGHSLLATIPVQARSSDGSEVTALPFNPDFPEGFFVAMSDDKAFHIYDWRELQKIIDQQTQVQ